MKNQNIFSETKVTTTISYCFPTDCPKFKLYSVNYDIKTEKSSGYAYFRSWGQQMFGFLA